MRLPVFLLTALILPALLPAQTFPSIADVSKSLSILQSGMEVQAIAVDTTGNVYLAGTTGASGFAGATTRIGPLGDEDLFVIKTNAAVDQVLYATTIGGARTESLRAIQVDGTGNLYLLGSTISLDFPSTTFRANPTFSIGAIVMKLNAAGNALTYSSQLGSRMTALAMDIDSTGAAYITGATNTTDLATTPGVLKPTPTNSGTAGDYMGFILKLSPAGNSFPIVTYFGIRDRSVEAISVRSNGLLIIADGNLVLVDVALSQQLSSTPIGMSAARMAFDSTGNIHLAGRSNGVAGGFVLRRYAATGHQLTLDKTYPFSVATSTPRIAVTGTGRIFLFGQATPKLSTPSVTDPARWPDFPTLNASQPCAANIAAPNGTAGLQIAEGNLTDGTAAPIPPEQAIMILDPSGNVLHSSFTPTVVAQAAVAPTTGRIYTAASQPLFTSPVRGNWTGVVRFNPDLIPPTKVSPSCLAHSGLYTSVRLSPGAIMTIYGSNLGPDAITQFDTLDANGRVGATWRGVSVTVDGKPAPMIQAGGTQLSFVTPWTTRTDGAAVPVCVTYNTNPASCIQAGTTLAAPGAFPCAFPDQTVSCALNQDSSVHSKTNPAAPGSQVALFMTGFGEVTGTLVDGGVVNSSQLVKGTVTASTEPFTPGGGCVLFACASASGFMEVPVVYAGAAPSLVQGVNQVNLFIPLNMPSGLQTFTISLKPVGATKPITTTVQLVIR